MTCYCGHVEDEHEQPGWGCLVADCTCAVFDEDPDASQEDSQEDRLP